MQINSSWFPTLKRAGIAEADLQDPCTNVYVGAWIFSQGVARYGRSWQAIGAYYAGPYSRTNYAAKLVDYREYSSKVLTRWDEALHGGRAIHSAGQRRRVTVGFGVLKAVDGLGHISSSADGGLFRK
jgi:hypothetical protein